MSYEVFPFGKYKGILISELPTTYVAHALESFDLPEELRNILVFTFLSKIKFNLEDHVISDIDVTEAMKSVYKKHSEEGGINGDCEQLYDDIRRAIKQKF
jgi:uncharacterized protein (DUF3820 family)